jgi:hypothetical protein
VVRVDFDKVRIFFFSASESTPGSVCKEKNTTDVTDSINSLAMFVIPYLFGEKQASHGNISQAWVKYR